MSIDGCFSNPFQTRKTIISGTVTDNNTKLPVDSVQISLMGLKDFASEDLLQTTYTDENGRYAITVDVPKDYKSADIANLYFRKTSYSIKYRSYLVYYNSQQTMNCCRVEIGAEVQYDFILLPK